jgi:hypothetical protein
MIRQFKIVPTAMCRKHLIAEHNFTHEILNMILKGDDVSILLEREFIEPMLLFHRHRDLMREMLRRGIRHTSIMFFGLYRKAMEILTYEQRMVTIDRIESEWYLINKCPNCQERFEQISNLKYQTIFFPDTSQIFKKLTA